LKPWNLVRESLPFHRESWVSLAKSLVCNIGEKHDHIMGALAHRIPLLAKSYFSPLDSAGMVAPRYALNIFGIDLTNKMPLPHLLEAAKAGGWWWPFQYMCFASDNPVEIQFDERMRLHKEDGMALSFQDGWGFHALHGIRVPETVIYNRFSAAD